MNPLIATRIIFILGITNLTFGLLIFFSCRCLGGSKLGGRLMKYAFYQRYYRLHCYIWWVFWVSVMLHGTLAILFLRQPS